MNAKEYLSQARYIDESINSKKEEIQNLYDLATRCTTTWSDMPRIQPNGRSRMADCVMDMIEIENDIKKEMAELIRLKGEIRRTINLVGNIEYRSLLERRYLAYKTWEEIADELGYTVRHIHRLHGKALLEVKVPEA